MYNFFFFFFFGTSEDHPHIYYVLKKKGNHTEERTPRIYVVRPLVYIHGQRQGESSTNKYEKYKGGVEEFSQNPSPNPNTPKLLNIKEILSYYNNNNNSNNKDVILKC